MVLIGSCNSPGTFDPRESELREIIGLERDRDAIVVEVLVRHQREPIGRQAPVLLLSRGRRSGSELTARWAFRVHRSGLLQTTHGTRPVLISAAELG